jgi:L-2-hydroxyglutarate oxidase LhgO
VIAAGLAAHQVAALAGLDVEALGLRQRFCKGEWMALAERWRKAVGRLIYPLPEAHGLGIHLTRDVDGFLIAGPDVEWVHEPSVALDGPKRERFAEAVARYLPGVTADDLHPLTAGVRPKLGGPDDPPRDFAIAGAEHHGQAGLVVLSGIESPGLTASLALGDEVGARC